MKTIKELQEFIGTTPDGLWGPKSKQALDAILNQSVVSPPGTAFDERSERNIATLHPKVRPLARQLVIDAAMQGIAIKVTSGTRTYAEQDALYEQGRTKPGRIVTNARGGASNHNHGIAFDVTVFDGATPKYEGSEYKKVGAIGKRLGLSWGGDWVSMNDEPHFELRPDWSRSYSEATMLAELRRRHDNGTDAFA